MSVHDGHRDRMRKRIEKEGLDSLAPHEVLEVILYYCIPRADTNEIAHSLLKRFKTISRVLEADPQELQTIEGIGEYAASFLNILNQFVRLVNIERATATSTGPMNTQQAYSKYMVELFAGLTEEAVYILCLNAKGMLINHYKISEGDVVSTTISMRKISEIAMKAKAAYVVLAHNHPGGLAIPSSEDISATHNLKLLLGSIHIVLLDHIVVAGNDYISVLKQRNSYY